MEFCNPTATDPRPMHELPVNKFYQSFVDRGLMANYMSRRGSQILQVILGWEASGVKSYKAGRPQKFNDQKQINTGTVKAIELIGVSQMVNVPSNPPTDHIDVLFKQGYLVLVNDCNDIVMKLPLSQLNKQQNGGKLCFFDIPNLKWNNCYVIFPTAAGINSSNGMLFEVHVD